MGERCGSHSQYSERVAKAETLGLKHNVNLLVDYDPAWEREFRDERERLAAALGPVARGIEHYGSTAVPGMRAKPILDILVGVSPHDEWQTCRAPLERLAYDYAAHAAVPGHYVFGRGRDASERTHLVHVVEYLGEEWGITLAPRDALRDDRELRAKYAEEKERAAAASPEGRARYNELKGPFLDQLKVRLQQAGT